MRENHFLKYMYACFSVSIFQYSILIRAASRENRSLGFATNGNTATEDG